MKSILLWPNKVLKQISEPVGEITEEIKTLAIEMDHTMKAHRGLGLSAIQIGIPLRMFVVENEDFPVFINPTLFPAGDKIEVAEGCLSMPGITEWVGRHPVVRAIYTDLAGKLNEIVFYGQLAQVIQHETEHLNGRFFIDKLPKLRRAMMMGKINKLKQQGKWN